MRASTHAVSERMVDLLDPRPGERVLELAAGPGDTGFLAAPRLLPGGLLLQTDGVEEMVAAARRGAAAHGLTNVGHAVVDAQATGLESGFFDGVLCRFGVMLVPDCGAAVGEIARVLRPGGRAAIGVWGPADANDWGTAAGRAALELGLLERPPEDAPGPFRLGDAARLRALVGEAGLDLAALEDVAVCWRYASLDDWWEAACEMSRMMALLRAQLGEAQLEAVRAGAFRRLERYRAGDGTVAVPGLARVVLAVRG